MNSYQMSHSDLRCLTDWVGWRQVMVQIVQLYKREHWVTVSPAVHNTRPDQKPTSP